MKFGINFGCGMIPLEMRSGLRPRIRVGTAGYSELYMLVGVATTPRERDDMIFVAMNGTRKLHVVHKLATSRTIERFGIYAR